MVNCCECGEELTEIHDTTYANYTSERTKQGQHTGDIYKCPECETCTIDDHLNCVVRPWNY